MRKLPGASDAKHNELNNDPSNDTGVGRLGLISELSLSLTLENLLPSDISQTGVEVLNTRSNILNLALVAALNLVGLADYEVERELDATVGVLGREP
jgi:hypothetical protein